MQPFSPVPLIAACVLVPHVHCAIVHPGTALYALPRVTPGKPKPIIIHYSLCYSTVQSCNNNTVVYSGINACLFTNLDFEYTVVFILLWAFTYDGLPSFFVDLLFLSVFSFESLQLLYAFKILNAFKFQEPIIHKLSNYTPR